MSTKAALAAAACVAAAFLLVLAGVARAQVPPHGPGTVCVTPTFWCWAQPPGPQGYPCYCFTAQGPVSGVLS